MKKKLRNSNRLVTVEWSVDSKAWAIWYDGRYLAGNGSKPTKKSVIERALCFAGKKGIGRVRVMSKDGALLNTITLLGSISAKS